MVNPHTKKGIFGREEEAEKIESAIVAGQATDGMLRALAGRHALLLARRCNFDLVVAMYHDQGHGPVKVLGPESCVNICDRPTRIPDFRRSWNPIDIFGTGKADEQSVIDTIHRATQLVSAG